VGVVDHHAAGTGQGLERRAQQWQGGVVVDRRRHEAREVGPGPGQGGEELGGHAGQVAVELVGREPRGGSGQGLGQLDREARLAVTGRCRQDDAAAGQRRVEQAGPRHRALDHRRGDLVPEHASAAYRSPVRVGLHDLGYATAPTVDRRPIDIVPGRRAGEGASKAG
jgi:hypothetical protein